MSKLLELADRVKALTGPDREVDAAIAPLKGFRVVDEGHPIGRVCYDTNGRGVALPAYTRSLDAAMTLVPEGWRRLIRDAMPSDERSGALAILSSQDFESVTWGKGENWITDIISGQRVLSWAPTPALALCAASLRARHAVEEG